MEAAGLGLLPVSPSAHQGMSVEEGRSMEPGALGVGCSEMLIVDRQSSYEFVDYVVRSWLLRRDGMTV